MMMRYRLPVILAIAIVTSAGFARAQAPLSFEVVGNFAGKSPGKAAIDISGIACMDPPGVASRRCVVINDENGSGQAVTVTDRQLIAGEPIDLLGDNAVGGIADVKCPAGAGKAGEFDGEAVAFAKPYYYVVGSHGCSRNKGEFRATSFYLARFQVDADGKLQGNVERSTRLTPVLRGAIAVGSYFGKSLGSDANGLNIEGLAVTGDKLTVGLRAPSIDGKAFVVTASIAKLFADGARDGTIPGDVASLALGVGLGIRDMAPLPDGRTLILAGPAQEQNVGYAIFVADLRPARQTEIRVTRLGPVTTPAATIATAKKASKRLAKEAAGQNGDAAGTSSAGAGKAEAIAVLEATETTVRVLVLYDGVLNGRPTAFTFALK